jgi:hypothetical protein
LKIIVLDMVIGAWPCLAVTAFPELDVDVEFANEPPRMRDDRMTPGVHG